MPKPRKLTARQLIRKFPEMHCNSNCLENIACPICGNRDEFKVEVLTRASLTDDGTDAEVGDHEYSENSYIECFSGTCRHHGRVRDFTFPGLDELLSTCTCRDLSWYGKGHASACPISQI